MNAAHARRAVLAAVATALALSMPAGAQSATHTGSMPVAFPVKNTNTSGVPCPADGRRYTVRGHLTGPRTALQSLGRRAVTVYLYGLDTGEWNWRLTAVAGYDYPAELAQLGHVSLTIDMLGYGASGHPNGLASCVGSQADIAHQIITRLRNGDYQVAGRPAITFSKVVLAGHDIGGQIAQIEAYTYKDVDGLIVLTWAEQGFTPFLQVRYTQASLRCAMGGEPAAPGGPGGYVFVAGAAEDFKRYLFHNANPAVIRAAGALRQPNPCGYLPSAFPTGIATDLLRLGEINVPVLMAMGANDPVFSPDGWTLQKRYFTASADVTSVLLDNTGHFPMLERTAPRLRAIVADWLSRRGFMTTPRARR